MKGNIFFASDLKISVSNNKNCKIVTLKTHVAETFYLRWKKNIYSFPPIGSPDSGAFVTASDLDAFLRSVEAGEQLSPELTAAFFSPQVLYRVKDNWTNMYGYGLWFYVDKSDNIVYYQKEGINAGVSGLIRRYPALDVSVVLLSNLEDGVWQPIREIHDLLISGEGNK